MHTLCSIVQSISLHYNNHKPMYDHVSGADHMTDKQPIFQRLSLTGEAAAETIVEIIKRLIDEWIKFSDGHRVERQLYHVHGNLKTARLPFGQHLLLSSAPMKTPSRSIWSDWINLRNDPRDDGDGRWQWWDDLCEFKSIAMVAYWLFQQPGNQFFSLDHFKALPEPEKRLFSLSKGL